MKRNTFLILILTLACFTARAGHKVTVQGKVWADRIGWDKNYMMSLDADRLLASPSESQRKSVQLSFSCIYIAYSYLVRHKTAINVANFATKMLN